MVDSSKSGETETILNPEDNFEDLFLTQSHEKGQAFEDKFIERVSNFQRIQYSVRDLYRDLRDGTVLIKLLEILSHENLVSKDLDDVLKNRSSNSSYLLISVHLLLC